MKITPTLLMVATCLVGFSLTLGWGLSDIADTVQSKCYITDEGTRVNYIPSTKTVKFSDGSKLLPVDVGEGWRECD